MVDGFQVGCGLADTLMSLGAAAQCPDNNCNPRRTSYGMRPLYLTEYGFGFWVRPKPLPKPILTSPPDSPRSPNRPKGNQPPRRGDEGYREITLSGDSVFDFPGITRLVDLKLAEDACGQFAGAILKQLGTDRNLQAVFNDFLNQSKPHDLFTRSRPAGSFGEATVIGKLKDSTASMFLTGGDLFQTERDADNVIQELFHFAGDVTDEQLARALRRTPYGSRRG